MDFEENERIIIPDEDGEEQLFEILFQFDVDETGHSYIITTPVEQTEESDDEEGIEVFAFRIEDDEDDENGLRLFPIDSDEEWEMVEEMFYTLTEEGEE
jgi:uncharacterized protein YrzB (UPF0473 family)